MSQFHSPDAKHRFSYPWVWVFATILLCLFFAFAPVSGIFAQNKDIPGISQNSDAQSSQRYSTIFQNVFDFIQRHYVETVDPKTLFEGAMTGMFDSLKDPYSVFLTEKEMTDLNDTTQGSFGGVGLYISKQIALPNENKPLYVEVAAPIEDTPGWRAGISPGDLIIEINGESTEKLSIDEVLNRLRGTPGVDVKLVIRRGEKLEFPVTLTRAVIEVPNTKYDMIGDIGYLRLITFTPMTAERARGAINDFQSKNYKGLILDLRNNYGGLLNSAVDVCGLFLDGGVVVSTKSRIPSENHVFTVRKGAVVPADIPVIVLINRGSASASEIVAGALKDRGRAFLVGEKSYGKGSVQQVYPMDNVGFKITTARYYTPSDVNIDKIGIPPDREVKYPDFTDADTDKLTSLINDNKIPDFVKNNPDADAAQIDTFARTLEKEYSLDLTLLKRLIRNEQNRTTIAPVYDLEYDIQLQEAVKILHDGSYGSLMQTTKTLKELQDAAAPEQPAAS
ncbi:MAG: S41 family peptidase [Treponema sp.]|nr:S41 family peptidase [Treponema sp.]